jgi:hypothetical protein
LTKKDGLDISDINTVYNILYINSFGETSKGGERMNKRIGTFLMVLVFFSFSLSGCYYFAARNEIKTAEKLTSELKEAGGSTRVPYEYCSAEKFLEISKMEFSENDFKAAKGFASRSKSAAEAGLAEVKKK